MAFIKILIVEDTSTQAFILQHLLKQEGYEVIIKTDGIQALEFLKQNENIFLPDIVISDMEMPGMNGYELCKQVKHDYPEIYFIMVTGNKDIELIKKSFDAGAIDFIGKRSSKIELLSRIKNILRIKSAESKLQSLMDKLAIKNDSLTLGKNHDNDNLTGLLNRETIFKRYNFIVFEARENSTDFSVILFDINNFSKINEEYSFLKGDDILIIVSNMIQQNIPTNSIVGRFGGDQFIVLIPGTSTTEAFTATQKLLKKANSLTFPMIPDLNITLSAGLCSLKKQKDKNLIAISYKLLNKAKSLSPNRIEVEE